jgi:ferredoxin
MATVITSECINCGACEPECPNVAIYAAGVEWELNGAKHAPLSQDIFYIVPDKCSECVGFHDREACAVVCPVDCCIPDPQRAETEDVLIARARQLHPEITFPTPFPSRFRTSGGEPAAAAPASPEPAPAEQTTMEHAATRQATTHQSAPARTVAPLVSSPSPRAGQAPQTVEPPAAKAPEPPRPPTDGAAPTGASKPGDTPGAAAPAPKPAPPAAPPPTSAPAVDATAPAEAAGASAVVLAPATEVHVGGTRFAGELDLSYETALKQLQRQRTGYPPAKKVLALVALPILGALPAPDKQGLERATGDRNVFTAGATVLNVALNLLLYPALLALSVAAYDPASLGRHAFGLVVAGVLFATLEGAFRLRDVLLGEMPIEQAVYRGSLYGFVLRPLFAPIVGAVPALSERGTIVVDGFHGEGFEEKLDRERRYGEVYSLDEHGGGYLLRVEFPRRVPPSAVKQELAVSDEMPDYDYNLGLRDGVFIVHGRLTDPTVRRVAAFSPAFPPDFTTQVPLPGPVAGFVHRYGDKVLEIVLLKA